MSNSAMRFVTRSRLSRLLHETRTRLARIDPNEFAEFAFTDGEGRPLRQARVHRELQSFLSRHGRALIELPRDHGKTMQLCVRVLWELGRRPALRVKFVCATEGLAVERGRFLRQSIAANPRVRRVFPHLLPAVPWSAERFTVRRPAEIIGPSVTALGVGAASTGARADLLVCDDIVDVRAVRSRADRERVKIFYRDNLVNLLEPDGRLWNVFTPWHHDDLNAALKQNASYAHFRRAVGDELQPVWPELWPRERLAERLAEIGATSFARGYRLVCLPDEEALIRPEWVQYWREPEDADFVVLAIDPAVSVRSSADASALVTLARTLSHRILCREALALRVAAPDLLALIDAADRRWRPDVILFEANAAFRGLHDLLVRQTRFGGKVRAVTQTSDKSSRVNAFAVAVRNGIFRLSGIGTAVDPSQQALLDEMVTFPVGVHDDLLDAAAMGTAYLLGAGQEPRVL